MLPQDMQFAGNPPAGSNPGAQHNVKANAAAPAYLTIKSYVQNLGYELDSAKHVTEKAIRNKLHSLVPSVSTNSNDFYYPGGRAAGLDIGYGHAWFTIEYGNVVASFGANGSTGVVCPDGTDVRPQGGLP
jgi:hypothetical protein